MVTCATCGPYRSSMPTARAQTDRGDLDRLFPRRDTQPWLSPQQRRGITANPPQVFRNLADWVRANPEVAAIAALLAAAVFYTR